MEDKEVPKQTEAGKPGGSISTLSETAIDGLIEDDIPSANIKELSTAMFESIADENLRTREQAGSQGLPDAKIKAGFETGDGYEVLFEGRGIIFEEGEQAYSAVGDWVQEQLSLYETKPERMQDHLQELQTRAGKQTEAARTDLENFQALSLEEFKQRLNQGLLESDEDFTARAEAQKQKIIKQMQNNFDQLVEEHREEQSSFIRRKEQIESRLAENKDQFLFDLAAAAALAVANIHAQPDGNGRISIGIARYLIKKHTDRYLKPETLDFFGDKIAKLLSEGTVLFFPDEVNPQKKLNQARKDPDTEKSIGVSAYGNVTGELEQRALYAPQVKEKIENYQLADIYCEQVDPQEQGFDLFHQQARKLSNVFAQCSEVK
jgi:hypothetical protein